MELLNKLKEYGVGRRGYDDVIFADDEPPPKFGIYDEDEENLCHEIFETICQIPNCKFKADSLLSFENHYNALHRYACSQCKKILPSPHLLDLHLQETHDSFFAVMAAKKPSYSCYIEECKEKFTSAEIRLEHCVKIHRLPKDFRFEQPTFKKAKKVKNKNQASSTNDMSMEIEENKTKPFAFANSRQRGFVKYSGKKFTDDMKAKKEKNLNIDEAMEELRENLPG